MTEVVVDTNVWVMVDFDVSTATLEELDCATACLRWLHDFVNGTDKLVVDLDYKIIKEYRDNIAKGGLANQWLNRLETQPRDLRLVEVQITYDEQGYAIVPPKVAIQDKNDRKFVAVALACQPTPPLVNGTDTDWSKDRGILEAAGIQVQELCSAYIQTKLSAT